MGSHDLEKLTEADLKRFGDYLKKRYQTVEEGYDRLRRHLQRNFPPAQFWNSDELIGDIIDRVITKFVEFDKRGERIDNLEAFARQVGLMIIREHARKKKPEVPLETEDSGTPDLGKRSDFSYQVDQEIDAFVREIKEECTIGCLRKLATDKRALLLAY